MKKFTVLLALILVLCSHDMFLKIDSYFLKPNSDAIIQLFNGTFEKSENVIDRDRMLDASIISNGNRTAIKESQWTEKDSTTFLNFKTGDSGTYVAGVSTKARNIDMEAEAFNNYLEHDGVVDMLQFRKDKNLLEENAVEKYSKHVKTIFQVGDSLTDDWNTVLGYPIEFVPLQNPYGKHTGDSINFKLLCEGAPLKNQLVIVDHKSTSNSHSHNDESHSHGDGEVHSHSKSDNIDTSDTHSHEYKDGGGSHSHGDSGTDHSHEDDVSVDAKPNHSHDSGMQMRTNNDGELTIQLDQDGVWFLRTIHMVMREDTVLTHESNWATITFEVTHDHGDEHSHNDGHEHEDGIPTWIFIVGSLILIGILFLVFRGKK